MAYAGEPCPSHAITTFRKALGLGRRPRLTSELSHFPAASASRPTAAVAYAEVWNVYPQRRARADVLTGRSVCRTASIFCAGRDVGALLSDRVMGRSLGVVARASAAASNRTLLKSVRILSLRASATKCRASPVKPQEKQQARTVPSGPTVTEQLGVFSSCAGQRMRSPPPCCGLAFPSNPRKAQSDRGSASSRRICLASIRPMRETAKDA